MKPRHPGLEPDAAAEIERLKGPLMEPDEPQEEKTDVQKQKGETPQTTAETL